MMLRLYNILIGLYKPVGYVYSFFNSKAGKWFKGQQNIKQNLKHFNPGPRPVIWFHCASLGEFEQGRPLIEAIRKSDPNLYIVLTFFSPSGYEYRKHYTGADFICYLPLDTSANARFFINHIKPKAAFFIKYEFWFNYINQLHSLRIPVFLISGIFRPSQYFFKWYGKWALNQIKKITHFFVQNEASAMLLKQKGISSITVSGDTRFDRVIEGKINATELPLIALFVQQQITLIAGSCYPTEERMLIEIQQELLQEGLFLKLILVPHEINKQAIEHTIEKYGKDNVVKYTTPDDNTHEKSILIIDNVGTLSSAYKYADMAYVGGGFGKGIHNILEPAVYGIPVMFGPNHVKFNEAASLIESGGGVTVQNKNDMLNHIKLWLLNADLRHNIGQKSLQFVELRTGAVLKIVHHLNKHQLI